MSALPPGTDVKGRQFNVRLVPETEVERRALTVV
jgi:hypothetical protein